jgi:hypothetical protein
MIISLTTYCVPVACMPFAKTLMYRMSPSTTFVRYALRSSNVFSYLVNIFNLVVYVTHKHYLK